MNAHAGTISQFRSAPCPKCGGRMDLSRREPHPTLGLPSELRSYRCAACDHAVADETIEPGGFLLGRRLAAGRP